MEKNYRSSSAAYRAIRHYEAKNGKSNFGVEKIDSKVFLVTTISNEINFQDFKTTLPLVKSELKVFRYFPDGVKGEGYYELKTGDRRRPNSLTLTVEEMYAQIKLKTFIIQN